MWTNGNAVPALVTTNATVPPRTDAGVLGVGDTETLLGDERLDTAARSGVALTLGHWFDVRNDFHGGTIGLLTSFDRGLLSLDVATKLGLGNVARELTVDGGTHVRTPPGGQGTSPGGLLALPSNMGTYKDDTFALLPELDLQARLWLTDRLSFSVGYQLLFLTNVYRTGQQIDRAVSTDQLVPVLPVGNAGAGGQPHPTPLLTSSTLRAQSLTIGLSLTY